MSCWWSFNANGWQTIERKEFTTIWISYNLQTSIKRIILKNLRFELSLKDLIIFNTISRYKLKCCVLLNFQRVRGLFRTKMEQMTMTTGCMSSNWFDLILTDQWQNLSTSWNLPGGYISEVSNSIPQRIKVMCIRNGLPLDLIWSQKNVNNGVLPKCFHWIRSIQWQRIFVMWRAGTFHLLHKRSWCYQNTSKTHVRYKIFLLSPIHASLIDQIPCISWNHWIQWLFCSIFEKLQCLMVKWPMRRHM